MKRIIANGAIGLGVMLLFAATPLAQDLLPLSWFVPTGASGHTYYRWVPGEPSPRDRLPVVLAVAGVVFVGLGALLRRRVRLGA